MAGSRNKKKIPTYQAIEFEERITKKQGKDIENRMNRVDRDPKQLAKEIIFELPKLVFKNEKQESFYKLLTDKEVVVCQGVAGTGKAQPLYSKIYTPDGYKLMGDISVGDEICATDGSITRVTNVYPQGIKDVYRVHFTDSTHVDACSEHLWEVSKYSHRRGSTKDKKTILKTIDMIDSVKTKDDKTNYRIDVVKPLYFGEREVPVDPYLLGCLIGDGGMTGDNTVISSVDMELLEELTPILDTMDLELRGKQFCCDYRIVKRGSKTNSENSLKGITESLGLRCKSKDKFIPKEYIYNSVENRVALLQGLMDTDGTVDKRSGVPVFSTSSEKLKDDVCELINTLGGVVNVNIKKTTHLDSFSLHINLPNTIFFRLERKQSLVKDRVRYHPYRFIKHIEKIGEVEQQCISVEHENSLYVTDNCTITHNTYIAVRAAIDLLLSQKTKINRIYLTKPCQQLASENLGFIKGGVDEKLAPIMQSFDGVFEDVIGEHAFRHLIAEKIVVYLPMAFLRGQTLKNAVILFDEVQMSTTHSCRTLLQRMGEDSRVVLLGDKAQTEIKTRKYNPLTFLFEKFQPFEQFGVFEFLKGDIVRNPLIQIFETIFEEAEAEAEEKRNSRPPKS